MKNFFYCILLLMLFSCSDSESGYSPLTSNSMNVEQKKEKLLFFFDENDSIQNTTRMSLSPNEDFENKVKFVHRYYRWEHPTDANHHYSLTSPTGSNRNYIEWGLERNILGRVYKYEGCSFYTFVNKSRFFGVTPDLSLFSVYLAETNNTILYTLKSGEADPYKNNSTRTFLGYISSYKPASMPALVAIREYYSAKEKDYYYLSDDDKVNNFYNDGYGRNYVFTRIVGYTLQSYRMSNNYYNYFDITVDSSWLMSRNGIGSFSIDFATSVVDNNGHDSEIGKILSVQESLNPNTTGYFYVPPTRKIKGADLTLSYYNSKRQQRTFTISNFYFDLNYPNQCNFTRTYQEDRVVVEFKRTAANLWNIHFYMY